MMAGKYNPLENFLRDLPANQKGARLTFEQTERILNAKLQVSAYENQSWWDHEKEGNHINLRSWLKGG
jgi:hypothetical protein